jgi:putative ABC transport system substrate-binding protein
MCKHSRGLAETGYTVGENVAIEYRWADGHYDRIPDMVDDLVRRRVTVLAPNTPAAHAAKRAAGNIPVVFFTGEDPVASGLVLQEAFGCPRGKSAPRLQFGDAVSHLGQPMAGDE